MAKQVYEVTKNYLIRGVLDKNEDDEIFVYVDGETYNIMEILESLMGQAIEIKSTSSFGV